MLQFETRLALVDSDAITLHSVADKMTLSFEEQLQLVHQVDGNRMLVIDKNEASLLDVGVAIELACVKMPNGFSAIHAASVKLKEHLYLYVLGDDLSVLVLTLSADGKSFHKPAQVFPVRDLPVYPAQGDRIRYM